MTEKYQQVSKSGGGLKLQIPSILKNNAVFDNTRQDKKLKTGPIEQNSLFERLRDEYSKPLPVNLPPKPSIARPFTPTIKSELEPVLKPAEKKEVEVNEPIQIVNFTEEEILEIYDTFSGMDVEFRRINLCLSPLSSIGAIKRELRIPYKLQSQFLNDELERKMLRQNGYCFMVQNMTLFVKVHSLLKWDKYCIPIASILPSGLIRYFNYQQSKLLLMKLFCEYDKVRPISSKTHSLISQIQTILYPRGCTIRLNWSFMTRFTMEYAFNVDSSIKWPRRNFDSVFKFEELRKPVDQVSVIKRIKNIFREINPMFSKQDSSILDYINCYYEHILQDPPHTAKPA